MPLCLVQIYNEDLLIDFTGNIMARGKDGNNRIGPSARGVTNLNKPPEWKNIIIEKCHDTGFY